MVSIYGEGLSAGQSQIVSINRGAQDGVERGHVLALWRAGRRAGSRSAEPREGPSLPEERNGLGLVFRVFDRVSYALLLTVQQPVGPGDRISAP